MAFIFEFQVLVYSSPAQLQNSNFSTGPISGVHLTLKLGFWVENGGTTSVNTFFKDVARQSSDKIAKNVWRAFVGNSAKEIWDRVKELTGKGQGTCIKTLTIAGHGYSGVFIHGPKAGQPAPRGHGVPGVASGSGLYEYGLKFADGSVAPDTAAGGLVVADIKAARTKGEIIFCDKCRIQLHACWIDRSFFKALSEETGCEVVGAMGGCDAPSSSRGIYYLWRSGANKNPNETTNNPGNGFYKANPDGSGEELGNSYDARY